MLGAGAFQVQKWPAMTFGDKDWRKYAQAQRPHPRAGRGAPRACRTSATSPSRPTTRAARSGSPPASAPPSPTSTWAAACPTTSTPTASPWPTGRFFTDVDIQLGRRVAVIGRRRGRRALPRRERRWARRSASAPRPSRWWAWPSGRAAILGLESKDGFAVVPSTAFDQVLRPGRRTTTSPSRPPRPRTCGKAIDEVIAQLRRHARACAAARRTTSRSSPTTRSPRRSTTSPPWWPPPPSRVCAAGAAGGRHRHHEHHAGLGDRADPRDRRAHGARARGAAASSPSSSSRR